MYLENLHNLIQSGVDTGAYPGATYAVILKDKVYMNVVGLKAKYPQEEVNSIARRSQRRRRRTQTGA